MQGTAGARYLRMLLETVLADNRARLEVAPESVRHAGAALVAVGAVDPRVADGLAADLDLAVELRRAHPDRTRLAVVGPTAGPAGGITDTPGTGPERGPDRVMARAVATGANGFEVPGGLLTVEHISFGPDGATIVEVLVDRPYDPGPMFRTTAHDAIRPAPGRSRRWRPGPPTSARPWEQGGAARPSRAGGPGGPLRPRAAGPGRDHLRIVDDRGREYHRRPGTVELGLGGRRWLSPLDPIPTVGTAWLELTLDDSGPARLVVTAPGGPARGLPHGRSPAVRWLHGSLGHTLARALASGGVVTTAEIRAGTDALIALGLLDPTDPLLVQLALLDAGADETDGLAASLASPLSGRDRTPAGTGSVLALARLVHLGDRTARLDVAVDGPEGLRLTGRFAPWSTEDSGGWSLGGFDDRHNYYVAGVTEVHRDREGADATWQLWPAVDSSARSLRLAVAGGELEASVEIVLRP